VGAWKGPTAGSPRAEGAWWTREVLRADAAMLGVEPGQRGDVRGAPVASGVQQELWWVLGAGEGKRPGGEVEVEVVEDAAGDGGAEDAGHHPARAAAAVAGEHVLAERSFQQLGPREARGPGPLGGLRERWAGDDERAEASAGSQDAEAADEVDAWRRDERGQAPEEGQGREHQLGGAGGGGPLHAVAHLPVGEEGQAFQAERATRAIVAQTLEANPVVLVHLARASFTFTWGRSSSIAFRSFSSSTEGKATALSVRGRKTRSSIPGCLLSLTVPHEKARVRMALVHMGPKGYCAQRVPRKSAGLVR